MEYLSYLPVLILGIAIGALIERERYIKKIKKFQKELNSIKELISEKNKETVSQIVK